MLLLFSQIGGIVSSAPAIVQSSVARSIDRPSAGPFRHRGARSGQHGGDSLRARARVLGRACGRGCQGGAGAGCARGGRLLHRVSRHFRGRAGGGEEAQAGHKGGHGPLPPRAAAAEVQELPPPPAAFSPSRSAPAPSTTPTSAAWSPRVRGRQSTTCSSRSWSVRAGCRRRARLSAIAHPLRNRTTAAWATCCTHSTGGPRGRRVWRACAASPRRSLCSPGCAAALLRACGRGGVSALAGRGAP